MQRIQKRREKKCSENEQISWGQVFDDRLHWVVQIDDCEVLRHVQRRALEKLDQPQSTEKYLSLIHVCAYLQMKLQNTKKEHSDVLFLITDHLI